jgi:hypothetical protein
MSFSEKPKFWAAKYGDQHMLDTSNLSVADQGDERQARTLKRIKDTGLSFVDASDAYAGNGFWVGFEHVPSGQTVVFKAFISALNENFNSDWASESLFGRPDGIHMYKSTNRSITMSLKIPASSEGEGFENLGKVQQLVQFLYPAYENVENAQTIAQSPLVRLKIMNLFADRSGVTSTPWANSKGTFGDLLGSGGSSWENGLLGILKGLNIDQNIGNPEIGVFELSHGTILPKLIEINFDFDVVHEHALGWDQNGQFSHSYFPYGINLRDSEGNDKGAAESAESILLGAYEQRYIKQREAERGEAPPEQARANALSQLGAALADGMTARQDRRDLRQHGRQLGRAFQDVDETNQSQPAYDKPESMDIAAMGRAQATGLWDD